jgi:hypothetical protein
VKGMGRGSDTRALRGSKWREAGGGGGPIGAACSRAGPPGRQRCGRDGGGQRSGARHRPEEQPGADRRAPVGKRKETENEFNFKLK